MSFAGRFAVIAERLESGVGVIERHATCNADEVAIHIVVDFVIDVDGDRALDPGGVLEKNPNGPMSVCLTLELCADEATAGPTVPNHAGSGTSRLLNAADAPDRVSSGITVRSVDRALNNKGGLR